MQYTRNILPNFFIVGAAKAGTTSLWSYLSQHPDVYMPQYVKEPSYFTWSDEELIFSYRDWHGAELPCFRSWNAYLQLFENAGSAKAIGEASPSYLPHPSAPIKIKQKIGPTKIVIILRNPVDRAYSLYNYNRMRSVEKLPTFREAIAAELGCTRPYYSIQYLGVGLYSNPVSRYLQTFGRDKVKVLLFDDLKRDPYSVMRELFSFLEIDEDFRPEISISNKTLSPHPLLNLLYSLKGDNGAFGRMARFAHQKLSVSEYYLRFKATIFDSTRTVAQTIGAGTPEPLPIGDRVALTRYFTEDIDRLSRLIDRDLSRWSRLPANSDEMQSDELAGLLSKQRACSEN